MERKAKRERRGESKREGWERRSGEESWKAERGKRRVASWLLGGWTPWVEKAKFRLLAPPVKNRGRLMKISVGIIRP